MAKVDSYPSLELLAELQEIPAGEEATNNVADLILSLRDTDAMHQGVTTTTESNEELWATLLAAQGPELTEEGLHYYRNMATINQAASAFMTTTQGLREPEEETEQTSPPGEESEPFQEWQREAAPTREEIAGTLATPREGGSATTGRPPDEATLEAYLESGDYFRDNGVGDHRSQPLRLHQGLLLTECRYRGADSFTAALVPTAPEKSNQATVLLETDGPAETGAIYVVRPGTEAGPEPGEYCLETAGEGEWEVSLTQPLTGLGEPIPHWQDEGTQGYSTLNEPVRTGPLATELIYRHHGKGTFQVYAYPLDGSTDKVRLITHQGLLNTRKTTPLAPETEYLFEIEADSDWEIIPI